MKLVSKFWATFIESSKSYIASRQPLILYTYLNGLSRRRLRLVPQDRNFPEDGRFVELGADGVDISSPPVNGLICLHSDKAIEIRNFYIGKSVRLPELQKKVGEETPLFFGWDTSHHQFKVLCVHVEKRLGEVLVTPQIFALRGQSSSWRGISCAYPHLPIDSKSAMCKDGVIYYAAWNINRELFVMSFGLKSEVFLPVYFGEVIKEFNKMHIQMMNYNGDVSLVIRQPLPEGSNGFRFDLRIMKNEQGWDSIYFMIHESNPHYRPLFCKGTGDVVFAPTVITYYIETGKKRGILPCKTGLIQLLLRSYEPKKEGGFLGRFWLHDYDSFTDQFNPQRNFLDVQTFLGTVSFINPEELLE